MKPVDGPLITSIASATVTLVLVYLGQFLLVVGFLFFSFFFVFLCCVCVFWLLLKIPVSKCCCQSNQTAKLVN